MVWVVSSGNEQALTQRIGLVKIWSARLCRRPLPLCLRSSPVSVL